MIVGITFVLFVVLGFSVFWGGVKIYGKVYAKLARKVAAAKEEVKANDELLKLKVQMENSVAELTNEETLLDARVKQKQAHVDELSRDVASLKDQGTIAEAKAEIAQLEEKKESIYQALKDLKTKTTETEASFRTLDDTFTQEKALRVKALEDEMVTIRQKMNDEVNDDIAKFKEHKITETKQTLDTAKISAVRTIKEWWSSEKKRLESLLEEDFNQKREESRAKLAEEVMKEVTTMKEDYVASKS